MAVELKGREIPTPSREVVFAGTAAAVTGVALGAAAWERWGPEVKTATGQIRERASQIVTAGVDRASALRQQIVNSETSTNGNAGSVEGELVGQKT